MKYSKWYQTTFCCRFYVQALVCVKYHANPITMRAVNVIYKRDQQTNHSLSSY